MSDEATVRERLWPGEELLWVGRPRPGLHLRPGDAVQLGFMALWFGFLMFWTVTALGEGGGFFALFGVGMMAFGAVSFLGPRILETRRRRTRIYAVTMQRVLSFDAGTRSFDLPVAGLPVSTYQRRGGCTVVFSDQGMFGVADFFGLNNANRRSRQQPPPMFADVADGTGLLAALDRARSQAGSPAPGTARPEAATIGTEGGPGLGLAPNALAALPPPPAPSRSQLHRVSSPRRSESEPSPVIAERPDLVRPPSGPGPGSGSWGRPSPAPSDEPTPQLPGWGSAESSTPRPPTD